MSDLLGFASILLVSLLTFVVGFKWSRFSKILFVALLARVTFFVTWTLFYYFTR